MACRHALSLHAWLISEKEGLVEATTEFTNQFLGYLNDWSGILSKQCQDVAANNVLVA